MAKLPTAPAGYRAGLHHMLGTRALAAACVAAGLLSISAPTAQAHEHAMRVSAHQQTQPKRHRQTAELNLLRQARPDSNRQTRRPATVGRGSYICSPAGFGRRSRCYSN